MHQLRRELVHNTPPGRTLTYTMIPEKPLSLHSILWCMLLRKSFVAKTHNGQYIGCTPVSIAKREKKLNQCTCYYNKSSKQPAMSWQTFPWVAIHTLEKTTNKHGNQRLFSDRQGQLVHWQADAKHLAIMWAHHVSLPGHQDLFPLHCSALC